uniref:Uncharacterized protein n=1 Tax=Oryza meridionalis TaxID=40149 RepID=A0A0E0F4V7_9ORYZ
MSNTGDDNNTGDKEKEASVNTNGGNTASNTSGGPFLARNLKHVTVDRRMQGVDESNDKLCL